MNLRYLLIRIQFPAILKHPQNFVKLTCQQDAVVVLIVMVNWNGRNALCSQTGHHGARSAILPGSGELDDHVHRLLEHRVHANDALGQRFIAQNGA